MSVEAPISDADPFDLPSWLGEVEVTWHADRGHQHGHQIVGRITADGQEDLPCDLLAIDQAYPQEVAASVWRRRAHQAWHHGQVLLVTYGGRLTLAVPGHQLEPELVLSALARLAKAVGGQPERFVAALRVSAVRSRG